MARSTRTLIAIMLWLLAGFMGANNIVLGTALGEWVVPVIFVIIGLILALYPESEGTVAESHAMALDAGVTAAGHLPAPSHAPLPSPTPPPPAHAEPTTSGPTGAPPAAAQAAPVTGPNDLTVIEGIGPKMQQALYASGIDTYAKLAACSEDDLRDAIKSQGMRFAPSIPTWAAQASYAASGDFDGLSTFQGTLTAGRAD